MSAAREIELAAQHFATFADQALRPAVYPVRGSLSAGVIRCTESISFAQAARAKYQPVDIGWRWGPVWSTAWFHITGTVPQEFAKKPVALRFSSGTEALLWDNGVPRHGLDVNHRDVLLLGQDESRGGES